MRDPVRGEFRPTGSYFPHPASSNIQEMLTGVVSGPGIAPVAGEVLNDLKGGHNDGRPVLPALVDRADPAKFLVLWDELPGWSSQAQAARQAAEQAAEHAAREWPAESGDSA